MASNDQKMTLTVRGMDGRIYHLITTPKPVKVEKDKTITLEEEAKIQCPRCPKLFCTQTALGNHLNQTHGVMYMPEEEVYVDDICNVKEEIIEESIEESPAEFPSTSKEVLVSPITGDGRLVNLASENIEYVIVKTEGEDHKVHQQSKPRQVTTVVKKNQSAKTKNRDFNIGGPFECLQPSSSAPNEVCSQMFFNCCEYTLHYRRDHTKRRKPTLRCQVCEKVLDGAIAASEGADLELVSRTCMKCAVLCADPEELAAHTRVHHARPKPFACPLCDKAFTQKGGLQQHTRLHTGDRPFSCDVCNKAFTQKANLDQHQRTHTKVKPFRCVVCNKYFGQIIHLRQHMRTHTNITPFECPLCGRRFKQSSHLNFHMRSHSGHIQTETVDPSMDEESGVRYIVEEGLVETVQEDSE